MEIQIDTAAEPCAACMYPANRGNRFSMQIARRERSGSDSEYSQMQLTELRTLENSPVRGLIRATGCCNLRGERTADFEIDYELLRGQRVLSIDVRMNALIPLTGSPWISSYVVRTAWPNESSVISTRSCASRQAFPSGRAVATEWIEIDDVEYRTYLLTTGLPVSSKSGTTLSGNVVGLRLSWPTASQLGVGIDLPNACASALQFGNSAFVVFRSKRARWIAGAMLPG